MFLINLLKRLSKFIFILVYLNIKEEPYDENYEIYKSEILEQNLEYSSTPNDYFENNQNFENFENDTGNDIKYEDPYIADNPYNEFECEFCDMKFRKKGDLKSHVICFHEPNSDKPQKPKDGFKCLECDYGAVHVLNLLANRVSQQNY